jgi:hypothetical protein
VPTDVVSVLAEIESALRVRGDVEAVERTLTTGYARALTLEAERWRLERKISDAARRIADGDTTGAANELSSLSKRLTSADGELDTLRASLTRLRRHADALRAP